VGGRKEVEDDSWRDSNKQRKNLPHTAAALPGGVAPTRCMPAHPLYRAVPHAAQACRGCRAAPTPH